MLPLTTKYDMKLETDFTQPDPKCMKVDHDQNLFCTLHQIRFICLSTRLIYFDCQQTHWRRRE